MPLVTSLPSLEKKWAGLNLEVFARVLLIAYAVLLVFRGTAAGQAALLLTAFAILIFERRLMLKKAWDDARRLLGPLLLFSLWVFVTSPFWPIPETIAWDTSLKDFHQPWFSYDQWRRDIGQPMLALLCGYWAFQNVTAKKWLFTIQFLLILLLTAKGLYQFYHGEIPPALRFTNPILAKGTLSVIGFSRDNIFFSYVLLLLVPGLLWLILESKVRWKTILYLLGFLLLLYVVFLGKRRGTWLALYLEFFILSIWLGRKYFLTFFVCTLLCLGGAYHFRPQWFQRDYDASEIQMSRHKIAQDLPPLLLKHPWIGVGFGKNTAEKHYWSKIYLHAHNTFANLALEVGFPGLLIWLVTLGTYAWRFWNGRASGWTAKIGMLLLVGFCLRNTMDDLWIASIAELFWFSIGVFIPSRSETSC